MIDMYLVTISEMMGTGGETIAREVARELGYAFYGEKELTEAAERMGFVSDLKSLDEKAPALFERLFSEKPKIYLDRLQSVIFEVAKNGNALFFGRGSQLLLSSFDCALHVFVTGSFEKRVERVMKEMNVTKEVAERIVLRSDHEKRGFLRFAFDEDWLNPKLYDLILNTDILSTASAIRIITEAARSDEIKACGVDAIRTLGRLSLQRRIEAALLEKGLASSRIFVTVEDDETVRLYGLAGSDDEKTAMEALLKSVKGVEKVLNEVTVLKGSLSGA
jgi:cytidylate kinase